MIIGSKGREIKYLIGYLKGKVCIAYKSYYRKGLFFPFFFFFTSSTNQQESPLKVFRFEVRFRSNPGFSLPCFEQLSLVLKIVFVALPRYKWPGSSLHHSSRIFDNPHRWPDSRSRQRTCHTVYQSRKEGIYTVLSCNYRCPEILGLYHYCYKHILKHKSNKVGTRSNIKRKRTIYSG